MCDEKYYNKYSDSLDEFIKHNDKRYTDDDLASDIEEVTKDKDMDDSDYE